MNMHDQLPIHAHREGLVDAVAEFPVLIVAGDTGSGKTTQLPQFLRERFPGRRIVVTQPRRIAAISAAIRVADETNSVVGGDTVGYAVRFEHVRSNNTCISFMTDGTLLRLISKRPEPVSRNGISASKPAHERDSGSENAPDVNTDQSSNHNTALLSDIADIVILDEAHERSLETDVLFGLLKQALRSGAHPNLKLVVMSATLNTDKFSEYFDNAPVYYIPGRLFPVEILHARSLKLISLKSQIVAKTVECVLQIHQTEEPGDVLVFLTGQQEIETACRLLRQEFAGIDPKKLKHYPDVADVTLCPIYSSLDTHEQRSVFQPAGKGFRKIVIATNIAQTSLTIPGIRFVVDCGFVKEKMFDSSTAMDALLVVPISKAAATQRAGRSGRTGPGKVFRLYSREAYEQMEEDALPEIQRSSLLGVVLALKEIGINDILNFEFIDAPSREHLINAMKQLYFLGALDSSGNITPVGHKFAQLPVSAHMAASLLASAEFGCTSELLTLAAILSSEELRVNPRSEHAHLEAEIEHAHFGHSSGDHVALLRMYEAWRSAGESNEWCRERFLRVRSLRAAKSARAQLEDLLRRFGLDVRASCRKKTRRSSRDSGRGEYRREYSRSERQTVVRIDERRDMLVDYDAAPIIKSICAGFFANTAKRHPQRLHFYHYLSSTDPKSSDSNTALLSLHISPSSCLSGPATNAGGVSDVVARQLDWIIYHDVQFVNRANMRIVSRIDFSWVQEGIRKITNCDVAMLTSGGASTKESSEHLKRRKVEEVDKIGLDRKKGKVADEMRLGSVETGSASDVHDDRAAKVQAAKMRFLARRKESGTK
ncbi:ATP-dependent RNA helicase dhx8 [Entophlyctis sp. JEL0112]|nr:ATP-dependent RNA helicase dhx8 [Entophlyctis sp. JEL0112]